MALTLALVAVLAGGCVRRTLAITTEPAGALLWLNDREIGRTPAQVDFLHYGQYSVRLELEGYEPLTTFGDANPPWWDLLGPDLVSEMIPAELHSEVEWHYQLEPLAEDPAAVVERAKELRASSPE